MLGFLLGPIGVIVAALLPEKQAAKPRPAGSRKATVLPSFEDFGREKPARPQGGGMEDDVVDWLIPPKPKQP